MELLDIVNENNEIIGVEKRNKAHKNHLLHRAVIILIANNKNKFLLQLRKSTKKQYPLYWAGSVNGHVSSGDSFLEAAKKEMKEEIGIETELKFIDKFIIDNKIEHEIVGVFFARYNGSFNFDMSEIEKINQIDVQELKDNMDNMKMTPHCKKALHLIFKKYF